VRLNPTARPDKPCGGLPSICRFSTGGCPRDVIWAQTPHHAIQTTPQAAPIRLFPLRFPPKPPHPPPPISPKNTPPVQSTPRRPVPMPQTKLGSGSAVRGVRLNPTARPDKPCRGLPSISRLSTGGCPRDAIWAQTPHSAIQTTPQATPIRLFPLRLPPETPHPAAVSANRGRKTPGLRLRRWPPGAPFP
jgi:hypothetical protein